MKLERKTALRFLKMGIAMYESGNLEENILNVVDQYIPEQYQVPKKYRKRYGKKKGKKNSEQQQQQQQDATTTMDNVSQKINEKINENIARRFGPRARTTDMVESKHTQQIGKDRFIDTTTRSVYWDVPGEDAINPNTWNWKDYATPGELENYEKDQKRLKKKRREASKLKKQQQQEQQSSSSSSSSA